MDGVSSIAGDAMAGTIVLTVRTKRLVYVRQWHAGCMRSDAATNAVCRNQRFVMNTMTVEMAPMNQDVYLSIAAAQIISNASGISSAFQNSSVVMGNLTV